MNDESKKPRPYTLHKSRGIMKLVYSWYKRKGKTLAAPQREALESDMMGLDGALLEKNREEASQKARHLEIFANKNCKRSIFEYSRELIFALIFALVIATLVRQMWFEPYEIPTGSMRPTFREQDHLTVTKTAFGINFPLETRHLYFDPDLVQRSSVVTFSGDGIPLLDSDTKYFGIFPYKKKFIKRLIGKPGDSLYFYGGNIYGVDKDGQDITELRDTPWMQALEYIPFLSFEGNMVMANPNTILIRQMLLPFGKFQPNHPNQKAEVFNGKTWVVDSPVAQMTPHTSIKTYSDILGIRNYAEARLLTPEELKQFPHDSKDVEEGLLYLQLHHTPSLNYPKPIRERGYFGITGYSTIIPLQQHHLDLIINNIYTSRFVVEDGKAHLYSLEESGSRSGNPEFTDTPDGTYEFYYGKASKIHWLGVSTDVPDNSAFYSHDPQNVQKLYNFGIEMDTDVTPSSKNLMRFPHRYAYFRDGDLYLMGVPVLKKDDPTLIAFHKREEKRQADAQEKEPYVAFKDYGPPMKDGHIDVDFIRTFGVTVPAEHYVCLGDNHARSFDSRAFGFVPQNNLQGAPCWIVWPPGERLGSPPQKPYPFLNVPRGIVWSIAAVVFVVWYIVHRRNLRRPIFKKIS